MDGRWALGGWALQAARRAGAGRSWRAEQTGRAAGRARERQARRAAGAQGGRYAGGRRAGARACTVGRAAGALLGARSLRGTGAVRAATHGLSVAWALDGCAGWASWASFVHSAPGSVLA